MLDVVLQRLKRTRGFERLAKKPPRGFRFRLADGLRAKITDRTKPKGKQPASYEA